MQSNPFSPVSLAAKVVQSKFCTPVVIAMLTFCSTTAFAKVCPETAQFDATTRQYKTADGAWVSSGAHRSTAGVIPIKAIRVIVDHKKGDTLACEYAAAHETVVLKKQVARPVNVQASAAVPEIVLTEIDEWDNSLVKNEFRCDPNLSKCVIDRQTLEEMYAKAVEDLAKAEALEKEAKARLDAAFANTNPDLPETLAEYGEAVKAYELAQDNVLVARKRRDYAKSTLDQFTGIIGDF